MSLAGIAPVAAGAGVLGAISGALQGGGTAIAGIATGAGEAIKGIFIGAGEAAKSPDGAIRIVRGKRSIEFNPANVGMGLVAGVAAYGLFCAIQHGPVNLITKGCKASQLLGHDKNAPPGIPPETPPTRTDTPVSDFFVWGDIRDIKTPTWTPTIPPASDLPSRPRIPAGPTGRAPPVYDPNYVVLDERRQRAPTPYDPGVPVRIPSSTRPTTGPLVAATDRPASGVSRETVAPGTPVYMPPAQLTFRPAGLTGGGSLYAPGGAPLPRGDTVSDPVRDALDRLTGRVPSAPLIPGAPRLPVLPRLPIPVAPIPLPVLASVARRYGGDIF